METMKPDTGNALRPRAQANRQRRIAWEGVMIAQADASIAAGRVVNEAAEDAWTDSVGTGHELPVRYASR